MHAYTTDSKFILGQTWNMLVIIYREWEKSDIIIQLNTWLYISLIVFRKFSVCSIIHFRQEWKKKRQPLPDDSNEEEQHPATRNLTSNSWGLSPADSKVWHISSVELSPHKHFQKKKLPGKTKTKHVNQWMPAYQTQNLPELQSRSLEEQNNSREGKSMAQLRQKANHYMSHTVS